MEKGLQQQISSFWILIFIPVSDGSLKIKSFVFIDFKMCPVMLHIRDKEGGRVF
jgi:hypothetical protein